jgi:dethiobiotin synthetase
VLGLAAEHDLVLVEGAGGLLVRFDAAGRGLADLAAGLAAPVLVVAHPSLGTLNHTALTVEAVRARGLGLAGVVLGSWPADPDLACRANLPDLATLLGRPVDGAIAQGAGALDPDAFVAVALAGLAPGLGGSFDAADFHQRWRPDGPSAPTR